MSINDFEILAEFNVLQNLHLCAQKIVCATNLGPFGEIGANFSLQLSSRTRFDKINKKKFIAENQCKKHKRSSFFFFFFFNTYASNLDQIMGIWFLLHCRATMTQASLRS